MYVKVVEHREMDKVSLSMKVVDQATGEDLDPRGRGVLRRRCRVRTRPPTAG